MLFIWEGGIGELILAERVNGLERVNDSFN